MECPFVVGQKVVCIAHGWVCGHCGGSCGPNPQKDQIYTIADMIRKSEMVLLRFKEFPLDGYEWAGFRPLQERPKEADTDISVFYPLQNVRERERV